MKVLYIAAECKPFSKVGGVGDVAGELPPELKRQGVDIHVATPLYGSVHSGFTGPKRSEFETVFNGRRETTGVYAGDLDGVPVHFIKNATYFEGPYGRPYIDSSGTPFCDDMVRFSFFAEACLHLIESIKPDIVHVNDWVLGVLFGRMAMKGLPQKRVLTVHNIGYQGNLPVSSIQGMDIRRIHEDGAVGPLFADPHPEWNSVNALRLGLELAHMANTVSPTYCREIVRPENPGRFFEGGRGLQDVTGRLVREGRLTGILNGFKYASRPTQAAFDKIMAAEKSAKMEISGEFADPDGFLLGFVGRAVEQKFRLLAEPLDGRSVLEHVLEIPGVNVAILAAGSPYYEAFIGNVRHRGNYRPMVAFDTIMARLIVLGSDVFLMPSLFEPCGITQMESMSAGTPPLVRWTGGLADTVVDYRSKEGTGFGFDGPDRIALLENLIQAVRDAKAFHDASPGAFQDMRKRAFKKRFLWSDSAKEYIGKCYLPVLRQTGTHGPGCGPAQG
jgi:starch synthase